MSCMDRDMSGLKNGSGAGCSVILKLLTLENLQ